MKHYKITYLQKFRGEILEDSYCVQVENEGQLQKKIDRLYEDSHVFSVNYKEVIELNNG